MAGNIIYLNPYALRVVGSIQPLSPIDLVKFIPGILFATDKDKLAKLINKLNEEI